MRANESIATAQSANIVRRLTWQSKIILGLQKRWQAIHYLQALDHLDMLYFDQYKLTPTSPPHHPWAHFCEILKAIKMFLHKSERNICCHILSLEKKLF